MEAEFIDPNIERGEENYKALRFLLKRLVKSFDRRIAHPDDFPEGSAERRVPWIREVEYRLKGAATYLGRGLKDKTPLNYVAASIRNKARKRLAERVPFLNREI